MHKKKTTTIIRIFEERTDIENLIIIDQNLIIIDQDLIIIDLGKKKKETNERESRQYIMLGTSRLPLPHPI